MKEKTYARYSNAIYKKISLKSDNEKKDQDYEITFLKTDEDKYSLIYNTNELMRLTFEKI